MADADEEAELKRQKEELQLRKAQLRLQTEQARADCERLRKEAAALRGEKTCAPAMSETERPTSATSDDVTKDDAATNDVEHDEDDAAYDAALADVEKSCTEEIRAKMAALNSDLGASFSTQLDQFEQRFEAASENAAVQDSASLQTTDVLRVNKILRDVARGLGSDWKLAFHYLMSVFPKEEVEAEVDRISIQRKPFTQAYKAMTTWRDMTGEEFQVSRLVEVLIKCDKQELADRVSAILECDADTLLTLKDMPGPGRSDSPSRVSRLPDGSDSPGRPGTPGGGDTVPGLAAQRLMDDDRAFKRASINNYLDNRKSTIVHVSDHFDDRACLGLARRLEGSWVELAARLEVPQEEIDELKAEDAGGHQVAFRMLHSWKDSMDGQLNTSLVLAQALTEIGRKDLAETIAPRNS